MKNLLFMYFFPKIYIRRKGKEFRKELMSLHKDKIENIRNSIKQSKEKAKPIKINYYGTRKK